LPARLFAPGALPIVPRRRRFDAIVEEELAKAEDLPDGAVAPSPRSLRVDLLRRELAAGAGESIPAACTPKRGRGAGGARRDRGRVEFEIVSLPA
jgi:hypothetical protein